MRYAVGETDIDPFELNAEMPISILSPSSISTYLKCPEQFRHQYVLMEPRIAGGWAMSGTAFHEARRSALTYQMETGERLPFDKLRWIYEAEWHNAISAESEIRWGGDTPDAIFEAGWAMTEIYHRELGEYVKPVEVETSRTGFVDGVPLKVYGRIDVITADEVIDTKTGKNLFHVLSPEHYVQGVIYCWLTRKPIRWHSVSKKPAAATNDSLVLTPRPRVLASAETVIRQTYEGIRDHLRRYGPDEVWTAAGMANGSCRYCSFKRVCPHVPEAL